MPARTVYLETFGCQMNELDSELVSGSLRALGYRFTEQSESADVVLYNTCSVREHAEQKVWSRLGELALRKAREPGLVVGVLGCLAERDGEALLRRMPVVDILCGPGELDRLPDLLDNAVRTRVALAADAPGTPDSSARQGVARLVSARQVALQGNSSRRSATLAAAVDNLEGLDLSRAISASDHDGTAYVRITRGCNKFCTYCVVPYTRGAEVHRPPEHIVDECRRLADAGVAEITLLGQTVNHYRFEHGAAVLVNGVVQPQKGRPYDSGAPAGGGRVTTFADLLARIHEAVPALRRLRFVTSYPRDFGDDALQAIRDHPRICRYLHVPAQSGSDRVLKLMNRGYTRSEYLEFLARARAMLDQPEIGRPLMLAGDIIVGFPTESDEDYSQTRDLLVAARYKNCFIFKYSSRPGTAAHGRFADDVPEHVKRFRNNDLLALQASISDEISRAQLGRVVDVLVEGLSPRARKRTAPGTGAAGDGGPSHTALTVRGMAIAPGAQPDADVQLTGRTEGDQIVFFDVPCAGAVPPDDWAGRIVPVRITGADRLSLHGEPVDQTSAARRDT